METPWVIAGTDEETRRIAVVEAAAAGMPLGSWIDLVIKRHSEAPPVQQETARSGLRSREPAISENLLEILEAELDASKARIDMTLRPIGLALQDLAIRLVAAEASPQAADGETADTRTSRARPPSPQDSLAPVIRPTDMPNPVSRNRGLSRAALAGSADSPGGMTHARGALADAEEEASEALRSQPVPPTMSLTRLSRSDFDAPPKSGLNSARDPLLAQPPQQDAPSSRRGPGERRHRTGRPGTRLVGIVAVLVVVSLAAVYAVLRPPLVEQISAQAQEAVTERSLTAWYTMRDATKAGWKITSDSFNSFFFPVN